MRLQKPGDDAPRLARRTLKERGGAGRAPRRHGGLAAGLARHRAGLLGRVLPRGARAGAPARGGAAGDAAGADGQRRRRAARAVRAGGARALGAERLLAHAGGDGGRRGGRAAPPAAQGAIN